MHKRWASEPPPRLYPRYDASVHKNYSHVVPTDEQLLKWFRTKDFNNPDFKAALEYYPGRDYIGALFKKTERQGRNDSGGSD